MTIFRAGCFHGGAIWVAFPQESSIALTAYTLPSGAGIATNLELGLNLGSPVTPPGIRESRRTSPETGETTETWLSTAL